jgi:hypothetical protein
MAIGLRPAAVPGLTAKMFPIWSTLTPHPKLLHSPTSQSRTSLSSRVSVRRHIPVPVDKAPHCEQVSWIVLLSLSPLTSKPEPLPFMWPGVEAIVVDIELVWRSEARRAHMMSFVNTRARRVSRRLTH